MTDTAVVRAYWYWLSFEIGFRPGQARAVCGWHVDYFAALARARGIAL